MIEQLLKRSPILIDQEEIHKHVDGKTVLITGAAGSIGSEIVRQLLHFSPKQLVLLDQSETGLFHLQQELTELTSQLTPVTIFIADITDSVRMNQIFQQFLPDILFHAAAYKHVPLMEEAPYASLKINFFGTKLLADLALKMGVKDFIFLSTDKAVNPISTMGKTKRLAEWYLQAERPQQPPITRFVILRFGNVLGSNGSILTQFTKQILTNQSIKLTHAEVSRYFISLQEAGQLALLATCLGNSGELLAMTMGKPVPIKQLATRLFRMLKPTTKSAAPFTYIGLRAGEKLHEELTEAGERVIHSNYSQIKRIVRDTPCLKELDIIINRIKGSMLTGDDKKMNAALQLVSKVTNQESPTDSLLQG